MEPDANAAAPKVVLRFVMGTIMSVLEGWRAAARPVPSEVIASHTIRLLVNGI